MKKILLSIVIICISICKISSLLAQMVYMPDSMFRLALINQGYVNAIVGDSINSLDSTVIATTYLDVNHKQILSLQGIQAFNNLTSLECSDNIGIDISMLQNGLKNLFINDCDLSTLQPLPNSIENLNCDFNQLSTVLSLPSSLKTFSCSINMLSSLPPLPNNLEYLYCSDNLLTSLPNLPNSLIYLMVQNNQLTSLPPLPINLKNLFCTNNLISSLPLLFDSLTDLGCYNNLLSNLPNLPLNLRYLDCGKNSIASLPILPSSLQSLYCSNNLLTVLPTLPGNLINLYCDGNQISILPTLPNSIVTLHVYNNNISALPSLPASLLNLYCSDNPISSIPALPNLIEDFACNNCLLSALPELPDIMDIVECRNNPQLFCLPKLKKIFQLDFYNCPVNCIPNYGNISISYPDIGTMPLCDIFNNHGCDFFWNISGRVYLDNDSNCVDSVNDLDLENVKVLLFRNGNLVQQTHTRIHGSYSFDVDTFGIYKTELDTPQFNINCPVSRNYIDTLSQSDSVFLNNDFALHCKSGFDLAVWSIVAGSFRPGRTSTVDICGAGDITSLYGLNCAGSIGATLTVTLGAGIQYVGPEHGALIPSVSGNIITYNIIDVSQIHPRDFNFSVITDSTANIGDEICFTANIYPIIGDYNNSNNSLSLCFPVVNSQDPNDKTVYPSGITDTSQHWLTYTLRFQNVGNAPAIDIYVLDTLNQNLDVSTFQLMSTSHEGYFQILNGGIARFNFPNINLADSFSNEPMSHGYVQYRIKLKDNLPIGTSINNTGYIYFDFNSPVVTNTTLNTIGFVSGIEKLEANHFINAFPVPFSNRLIIECDAGLMYSDFSITNVLSKELFRGKIHDASTEILTNQWPAGIYFIQITTINTTFIKRIIKS